MLATRRNKPEREGERLDAGWKVEADEAGWGPAQADELIAQLTAPGAGRRRRGVAARRRRVRRARPARRLRTGRHSRRVDRRPAAPRPDRALDDVHRHRRRPGGGAAPRRRRHRRHRRTARQPGARLRPGAAGGQRATAGSGARAARCTRSSAASSTPSTGRADGPAPLDASARRRRRWRPGRPSARTRRPPSSGCAPPAATSPC